MKNRITGVKVSFEISSQNQLSTCGKEYTFKSFIPVEVGDLVVVECINGYGVAVVTETFSEEPNCTGHVISKVSLEEHLARRERIKVESEYKEKLTEKLSKYGDGALLELIAEKDPETRAILEYFKHSHSNVGVVEIDISVGGVPLAK